MSVETYVAPKGPLQCKRCQRLGHTQRNCVYAPRCVACGATTSPADTLPCGSGLSVVGEPHSELAWLRKVEGGQGGSCKAGVPTWPTERRNRQTCRPYSSASWVLCRADGPGRGMEPCRPSWACRQGYHPSIHQLTSISPLLSQSRKRLLPGRRPGPKILSPNPQHLLNGVLRSIRRKQPRLSKLRPPQQHPTCWPHLPTRGYLRSPGSPSPPCKCGADSSAPYVHLFPPHRGSSPTSCPEERHSFVAEYVLGGQRFKALRLARWNAVEVRGRKLELERFLSQHVVDICLLSQTFLNPGQAFGLSIMSATAQTHSWGGTAILVRRGIVHHSVPVPGLTHLETAAIQVTLAGKPLTILAAYLSPSHQ